MPSDERAGNKCRHCGKELCSLLGELRSGLRAECTPCRIRMNAKADGGLTEAAFE